MTTSFIANAEETNMDYRSFLTGKITSFSIPDTYTSDFFDPEFNDTIPPASVRNLRETGKGTQWIRWQ